MAHGGARPGAGRKPGAATKKTREAADLIAASGLTPLGYLVGLLDGTQKFDEIKFEAAKAAAPYVHARLTAAEVKSKVTHHYVLDVPAVAESLSEWQRQYTPKALQ